MKNSLARALLITIAFIHADERKSVENLSKYITISDTAKSCLKSLASTSDKKGNVCNMEQVDRPLYRSFLNLHNSLAHESLADLPTPISRLQNVESHFNGSCKIYLKDDGVTGQLTSEGRSFGGNKVRKLEFLLADAKSQGADSVLTFGGIGSNHVVATASCANKLGLRTIALLSPQDIAPVVLRNMRLMKEHNVEMICNPSRELRSMQAACTFVQQKYKYGSIPYAIPTGGSCPVGIMGFVNAAFELKEQIARDEMLEPDAIYVATGSCGTFVGLMLGVRAAGLKTKVVGVAVEPNDTANPFTKTVANLLEETNQFLHQKDSSFPLYEWKEGDVTVRYDFGGPDYGVVTKEGLEAIELIKQKESILLDTTYTGKAMAGMLSDIENRACDNQVILFWNTFCSKVAEPKVQPQDMPMPFLQYFN